MKPVFHRPLLPPAVPEHDRACDGRQAHVKYGARIRVQKPGTRAAVALPDRSLHRLLPSKIRSRRLCGDAILTVLIGLSLLCGPLLSSAAERRLVPERDRKIIVLDPGHGGPDTGAKGPGGSLEKEVVLRIAQLVSMRLRHSYRVILTRSDDYAYPLTKRTELANQHQAALFLSIHTGGAFHPSKRGVTVYSYQESYGDAFSPAPEMPLPDSTAATRRPWDSVQISHKSESKRLAEALYHRLCAEEDSNCRLSSAPLLVLMGADMPAALIEVGHITNPQDEITLSDKDGVSKIAAAISNAVSEYLSSRF